MLNKLKSKSLLFITLIILFLGGISFKVVRSKSQVKKLTTVKPAIRTVTQTLELSGEIDAHKKANLHFQTGGLVVYYPWQEGDHIKKFQTIASLDQRQLKKTLQQKLNLYAKQRNSFDQTQDDYRKNIDDGDIDLKLKRLLENAQYDLNNSVLNVEIQDLALKYSYLYAPFSGILTRSPITSPHVNILPTDVFTLVDPQSLYFSAEVEEGDLAKISSGMPVKVVLDAFPNQSFPGKIDQISFTAKETSTGTVYPLKISLPQDKLSQLRLSLNGTAYLILNEKKNVLSLPQEVIHEDETGTYVYLLINGKKQKRAIKVGLEGTDFVEVISGLSPEDLVISED